MGVADLVDGQGRRLRGRPERQVPGGGRARRRCSEAARVLAREARRDGGGEQRGPDGGVLREGHAAPGGPACAGLRAGGARRAGSSPCCPPRPLRNVGRAPAAGRDRRPPALARSTAARSTGTDPVTQGGGDAQARRRRALLRLRLQDHRRSRTPAASALFRVYSGTLQVRHHRPQRHPRRGRARGHLELLQGKTPDAGARDPGRRHRRGGQAEGDADRRHAVPTRRTRSSTRRWSSPSRPPPSPSSPRRAATRTRSRPPCTGSWRRTRCCKLSRDAADPRDAALGHGPAPHRGGGGASCASATRSRSTSRSRRSPTARRSRARRRATGATRSRRAATASSATARSA